MTSPAELPLWAAVLVSFLLLLGAGLTLIGSIGLLRFKSFYERIHAPAMGTGWGAGAILLASILFFTVQEGKPVLHDVLIGVFLMITTPVTLMLLTRAALYRHRTDDGRKMPKKRKRK
jgi:multicomponent K+:H+ antiporter subunit G